MKKKYPNWVLTEDKLSSHAEIISTQFVKSFVDDLSPNELDFNIPLPVGVTLHEKSTTKSYRKSIEKVFANQNGQTTCIGFSLRNELLFAFNTNDHIQYVINTFNKPEKNKKGISAITKIKKYKPFIEKNINLKNKLKIELIPYENSNTRKYLQASFIKFCKKLYINVKKCNYSITSDIYKISNIDEDSFYVISHLGSILSIKSMPSY